MSFPHASSLATLSASLVLGLTLAACSSDEPPEDTRSRTELNASDVLDTLHVRTTVSRVQGRLSQPQRTELEDETGRVLAGYLAAAYLHERPSDGYRGSFPGFTRGARELALRDVDTVADASYATAEQVRPRGAVAFLSVVAPEGRPVGVTARVFLDLAVSEGGRNRLVQVRGRLLLSPADDSWRIFGYDLSLDSPVRRKGR